ncbi:hypothetical protein HBH56_133660 [Parastagonospora nodorum]|nr:hypothetical protein HBH56_133660 [Parastagonospora nodorum]KAH3927146.1 hypothetical protein HBH54_159630 [Parastagonospora nodorum]KAH3974837.1 hypothetical protein HBH52_133010 [Parastagonospora nodorum]KAH4105113.1 hypothetical protein HBH46_088170 [Parastagonospora nodorum]KAH4144215.1 hypothetical protein HBH45_025400 [Parastagonospora nodorum]
MSVLKSCFGTKSKPQQTPPAPQADDAEPKRLERRGTAYDQQLDARDARERERAKLKGSAKVKGKKVVEHPPMPEMPAKNEGKKGEEALSAGGASGADAGSGMTMGMGFNAAIVGGATGGGMH